MTFEKRLLIGSMGEDIIKSYLKAQGYCVYETTSYPHPFDFLCYKDGKSFVAEVKTKRLMEKYAATGICIKHYKTYKQFQESYNIPVFIFFVDTSLNAIYGNYLNELDKPTQFKGTAYPIIMHRSSVIVFPTANMRIIALLSQVNGSYQTYNLACSK